MNGPFIKINVSKYTQILHNNIYNDFIPLILLSLYTNGGKVAFAAVPFPLLQIEEKMPLTIIVNDTTGPVTV
jgi:hypothetical protein